MADYAVHIKDYTFLAHNYFVVFKGLQGKEMWVLPQSNAKVFAKIRKEFFFESRKVAEAQSFVSRRF
ncbi:hypothetical protein GCM10022423_14180 [Flavobacterium ginsengiterrae]|uniref:Uncharacterized protein n=1 Tax=Flavobacterium ginsengiterrae TaxID=871695 RepID=A0ABP7GL48_9FLAO